MMRIGIIGYGYWGPNYKRIIQKNKNCHLIGVADTNPKILNELKREKITTFDDYKKLLAQNLDAIIIVTPTSTHFKIARDALNAKIHVLCEKPLALKTTECDELSNLSLLNKRILMTGYTFMYNNAFLKLKKIIERGVLGEIYYLSFQRMNLGPIRDDVNALWDLAPHDISMLYSINKKLPYEVSAMGGFYLSGRKEDVVFSQLKFANGVLAHVTSSWLAPVKVRQLTVVGSKMMAIFDDSLIERKITLYDKRVKLPTRGSTYYEFSRAGLKTGKITEPEYEEIEPLENQYNRFVQCIEKKDVPPTDVHFARAITIVLEKLQKSLDHHKVVKLK